MALVRTPMMSGEIVFARAANGDEVRARWTRHRLRYTGASWGFGTRVVTWQLLDDDGALTSTEEITLDPALERRLMNAQEPLRARRTKRGLSIAYVTSTSNHFGSCTLWMSLRIDRAQRTVRVVTRKSFVDLST